jgi:hypothetical protein
MTALYCTVYSMVILQILIILVFSMPYIIQLRMWARGAHFGSRGPHLGTVLGVRLFLLFSFLGNANFLEPDTTNSKNKKNTLWKTK